MRILWLLFWVGVLAATSLAGTIQFEVTPLGSNTYRYDYFLSDFVFSANQEVDIRFDPSLYTNLTYATGGSDFDVVVFQPDMPIGLYGDYSALALIDNPSLTGQFSVRFVFQGDGMPGSQLYLINQYDDLGNFLRTDGMSYTTPAGGVETPEPVSAVMAGSALLIYGVVCALRRRSKTG